MKNPNKFLNEEELFRIDYLVHSFGLSEECILATMSANRALNAERLDRFDASASLMFDCMVNSHTAFIGSKNKLPYQVWNSFRQEFLYWVRSTPEFLTVRKMLKELVLCNEDYKNYFKTYKPLWKFINRMIEEHNEFYKEIYHE